VSKTCEQEEQERKMKTTKKNKGSDNSEQLKPQAATYIVLIRLRRWFLIFKSVFPTYL
jgi:hypothetical protein